MFDFSQYPVSKVYLNQKLDDITDTPLNIELFGCIDNGRYMMITRCILMYVTDDFVDIRACSAKPSERGKTVRPTWGRLQIFHKDIGPKSKFYNTAEEARRYGLAKALVGDPVSYLLDSDASKVSPLKTDEYLEFWKENPPFMKPIENMAWVNALTKAKLIGNVSSGHHDVFFTDDDMLDSAGFHHPDFLPWHTNSSFFTARAKRPNVSFHPLTHKTGAKYDSVFLNYGPMNITHYINEWTNHMTTGGKIYGINPQLADMIKQVKSYKDFEVHSQTMWSITYDCKNHINHIS